jgi:hypothetical protein
VLHVHPDVASVAIVARRLGARWSGLDCFPPPPEDWSTATALEVLDIRDVAVTTEDRAANAAETPHVVGK